ncbi:FAD-binding oxidoreductase [Rhodoferax sp.]|uniref:NAD(P)/FAD-dependent oxidoreductase n=1 Tax=Rhodoferax sp. TaxID=50421 RepID=UPI002612014E|nr:FAD-binding oxidoreductase [Rhodoferax sp.]MDD2808784.1 FAD-binding oxidoreductase [Rhodoferax sp.]MDD4945177.1 FAD-binding oxidoreductase [Rhodoferax sp.]MDD5478104.1 FAD-binding oxidoreductase [Rhodoferax sp.]
MLLDSDTQLNQHSYYEASVTRPLLEPVLQGAVQADVLVVGAGFAGLSAAIELAQRGYQVAVLEADRVCAGASGRNGGQAIVGFASGQAPFEQQLGNDLARQAWAMSLQSLALIEQRVQDFALDCDWVRGYMYVADSARKARALQADCDALQRQYGFAHDFVSGAQVQSLIQSPRYCAAAFEDVSGHLHPLKYGLGLARAAQSLGVKIFEKSAVTQLTHGARVTAHTAHGQVSAQHAVLAGNCTLAEYAPQVAPALAPRIMPVGTYMISTEPLSPQLCQALIPSNAAVCDNNFVLDYFRFSADHRLLFGGQVSYSTRTPAHLETLMAQRMVAIFPQLKGVAVSHVWGGFVDISMNRAPDFGRLAANVYYLQGFSGHGLALTGLAGQLVAQAVAGQAERFDVFAKLQHRPFPGGAMLRTPSLVLGMLYHRLTDLW